MAVKEVLLGNIRGATGPTGNITFENILGVPYPDPGYEWTPRLLTPSGGEAVNGVWYDKEEITSGILRMEGVSFIQRAWRRYGTSNAKRWEYTTGSINGGVNLHGVSLDWGRFFQKNYSELTIGKLRNPSVTIYIVGRIEVTSAVTFDASLIGPYIKGITFIGVGPDSGFDFAVDGAFIIPGDVNVNFKDIKIITESGVDTMVEFAIKKTWGAVDRLAKMTFTNCIFSGSKLTVLLTASSSLAINEFINCQFHFNCVSGESFIKVDGGALILTNCVFYITPGSNSNNSAIFHIPSTASRIYGSIILQSLSTGADNILFIKTIGGYPYLLYSYIRNNSWNRVAMPDYSTFSNNPASASQRIVDLNISWL